MARKRLKVGIRFSSIMRQSKWIVSVDISGFSSRKPMANNQLVTDVTKAIEKYNKSSN
jgi:hypothetical protein